MRKALGKIKNERLAKKTRRKLSIRNKIIGTHDRPRVCVTRSNKNLFVQVIDDSLSKTLFSVQTFGKNAQKNAQNTVAGAKIIGLEIASKLKKNGLNVAVFDRSGNKYTGVVASLADGIRDGGIKI